MFLTPADIHLTRDEAATQLALPPSAIDALIEGGLLKLDGDKIPAQQLEWIFRDSLMRLYRTMAGAPTIEAAPQAIAEMVEDEIELKEPDVVVHSLAEYVAPAKQEQSELRIAPRYVPRRQLGGVFRQTKFTILQLSNSGMRVRHDDSLRPGDEAKLTFSILRPARTFALRAQVVWTSIAQSGDGPSFCISGLRVTGGLEQLRQALEILRDTRELQADGSTKRAPRGDIASPPALAGLSDDDVASIIRAYRKLGDDPVEANRWYTRARFALADETVRKAAPNRARDREEVLGVWEYLDRRVDIKSITGVLAWIRRSRAAIAVA